MRTYGRFLTGAAWRRVAGAATVALIVATGEVCAQPGYGPPPLDPHTWALFEAVHRNDLEAVRRAIGAGANPRNLNEWGLTAADVALDKGYFPIARYLMDVMDRPAYRVEPPVAKAPEPEPEPQPPQVAEATEPEAEPTPEPETVAKPEPAPTPPDQAAAEPEPAPDPMPAPEPMPATEPDPAAEAEPPETTETAEPETKEPSFLDRLSHRLSRLFEPDFPQPPARSKTEVQEPPPPPSETDKILKRIDRQLSAAEETASDLQEWTGESPPAEPPHEPAAEPQAEPEPPPAEGWQPQVTVNEPTPKSEAPLPAEAEKVTEATEAEPETPPESMAEAAPETVPMPAPTPEPAPEPQQPAEAPEPAPSPTAEPEAVPEPPPNMPAEEAAETPEPEAAEAPRATPEPEPEPPAGTESTAETEASPEPETAPGEPSFLDRLKHRLSRLLEPDPPPLPPRPETTAETEAEAPPSETDKLLAELNRQLSAAERTESSLRDELGDQAPSPEESPSEPMPQPETTEGWAPRVETEKPAPETETGEAPEPERAAEPAHEPEGEPGVPRITGSSIGEGTSEPPEKTGEKPGFLERLSRAFSKPEETEPSPETAEAPSEKKGWSPKVDERREPSGTTPMEKTDAETETPGFLDRLQTGIRQMMGSEEAPESETPAPTVTQTAEETTPPRGTEPTPKAAEAEGWRPKVEGGRAPAAPSPEAEPPTPEPEPALPEPAPPEPKEQTETAAEETAPPEPEREAAAPGPRNWKPHLAGKAPARAPVPPPSKSWAPNVEGKPVEPKPVPEEPEPGFLDRLTGEIHRLVGSEPETKTATAELTPPVAPKPKDKPEAPASEPKTWAPKVAGEPKPGPEAESPAPARPPAKSWTPQVDGKPAESEPGFLDRLSGEVRRLMGGEKAETETPPHGTETAELPPPEPAPSEPTSSEPAPSEAGSWAPKVEERPLPPPGKSERQPGFLTRLSQGIAGLLGGEEEKPAEPKKTEERVVEIPPEPIPPGEDRLAEAAPTPGEEPASLPPGDDALKAIEKLGIADASKYIADVPVDESAAWPPAEPVVVEPPDQMEPPGQLPPADSLAKDPFAPDVDIPGTDLPVQEPGKEGGAEQGYDPRFDRKDSPFGPGNEAFAPLGEDTPAPDSEAPAEPSDDQKIMDELADILSPVEPKKRGGAPPPPGIDEPAPEPAPVPEEESEPQVASLPPWLPVEGHSFTLPQATGKPLQDIPVEIAGSYHLGKRIETQTRVSGIAHGKACVSKLRGVIVFCVEQADWPEDVASYFDVNTILYQGKHAIVRYDDGAMTNFHALFPSADLEAVVAHFMSLYGPPTDMWKRRIAPLATDRKDNPTVAWRNRNSATGKTEVLEIRAFDDARGGFPDTQYGAVMLHYTDSMAIFPRLSTLDLMIMKPKTATMGAVPTNVPETPPFPGGE